MIKYFKYELKKDYMSFLLSIIMLFVLPIIMKFSEETLYSYESLVAFSLSIAYLIAFTIYRVVRLIAKDIYGPTKYLLFTSGIKKSKILLAKYIYCLINAVLAQIAFILGFILSTNIDKKVVNILIDINDTILQMISVDMFLISLCIMIYILLANIVKDVKKVTLLSMMIYFTWISIFSSLINNGYDYIVLSNYLYISLSVVFIIISMISIDKNYEI